MDPGGYDNIYIGLMEMVLHLFTYYSYVYSSNQ